MTVKSPVPSELFLPQAKSWSLGSQVILLWTIEVSVGVLYLFVCFLFFGQTGGLFVVAHLTAGVNFTLFSATLTRIKCQIKESINCFCFVIVKDLLTRKKKIDSQISSRIGYFIFSTIKLWWMEFCKSHGELCWRSVCWLNFSVAEQG